MPVVDSNIEKLRIRRDDPLQGHPQAGPTRRRWLWAFSGVLGVLCALGVYYYWSSPIEVEAVRVESSTTTQGLAEPIHVLDATGYIVAAHTIELASKVLGKVEWIGVEKGETVHSGQELVRLEDQEYKAQLLQAKGQLDNLRAHLAELENGSRPEETARAKADSDQAQVDLRNSKISLHRTRELAASGVVSQQALDDAEAKYGDAAAHAESVAKTLALLQIGTRSEDIDAARAQVMQYQGAYDYAQQELENTIIRAPIQGTILERNVEKGEFVTNGFVGDKGAKGYVVSLADLNDLQVELDINQSDFAKIGVSDTAWVTTDAYPDRKYEGHIAEVAPEANRAKGTVQIKVAILHPDDHLRPDMNASVAFLAPEPSAGQEQRQQVVSVPASAVRGNRVFAIVQGHIVQRLVVLGRTDGKMTEVRSGVLLGQQLVLNPPITLKDGDRVRIREER
jgi:HlyD family secretion protein